MATETDLGQILERIEGKMTSFETRMERLETKIDNQGEKLQSLESRVIRVEEKTSALSEQINKFEESTREQFTKLDGNLVRQDNRLWGLLVAVTIALFGFFSKVFFFTNK
jgi:chromosome segregation ATPase